MQNLYLTNDGFQISLLWSGIQIYFKLTVQEAISDSNGRS